MHRIVANCFKSIAFAILFIIIWDVAFYLWRANALNDRMESLAVSMQEVVSKNNYLPEGDAEMYKALLLSIGDDMNSGSDEFIRGFNWNYGRNSVYSDHINDSSGRDILVRDMSIPANYGDVMVVELEVGINATVWGKFNSGASGAADEFDNRDYPISFTYTYLVPCLNYTTVTN